MCKAEPMQQHTYVLRLEHDLSSKNDRFPAATRAWLSERKVVALNMLSSSGSGKTSLLERTVRDLRGDGLPAFYGWLRAL